MPCSCVAPVQKHPPNHETFSLLSGQRRTGPTFSLVMRASFIFSGQMKTHNVQRHTGLSWFGGGCSLQQELSILYILWKRIEEDLAKITPQQREKEATFCSADVLKSFRERAPTLPMHIGQLQPSKVLVVIFLCATVVTVL